MRNVIGFFGILVAAGAIACSSQARLVPSASIASAALGAAATPTPRAIITLHLIPGSSSKSGLDIALAVAGGPRRRFLFDTGSQGLWAYNNVVGSRYTSTGVAAMNTYGSNIVYNGIVVLTDVAFHYTNAGTLVAKMVPVVRVDSASCVPGTTCPATVSKSNCPNVYASPPPNRGQAGIACLEEGRGLFGTFGADLEPTVEPKPSPSAPPPAKQAVVYNLLFAIAPWSTTFIVDQTQLQLGPSQRAVRNFRFISMNPLASPLPTSLPNGAQPWYSHVSLCYTIGSFITKPYCRSSLFDTGAANVSFKGNLPVPIPTDPAHCGYVKRKLAFSVYGKSTSASGKLVPIGSFDTGFYSNWNAVHFSTLTAGKKPSVNTGLTFFNRDEILYDAVAGRIGLRELSTPGDIGKKLCAP